MADRRLFVALLAPDGLRQEAERWQAAHADLPVRWLAGKNLHVTLVPPWYGQAEPAAAALRRVAAANFEISFGRVAYGPDARAPRLIWAEGKASPPLLDLVKRINVALGQGQEGRPFRLHLTLARFRPEEFAEFSGRALDGSIAWSAPAWTFALMESHLGPGGADYEALEEFPLS
ncbi:MAG TPA: RNA 2',3'-cyclic phosphodiesterase [Candidatus Paceibacterota bacterium]|nr:RNA 2',3'-cyclic phosphodiesterase [Candidatus Paceibacterota bacterium]